MRFYECISCVDLPVEFARVGRWHEHAIKGAQAETYENYNYALYRVGKHSSVSISRAVSLVILLGIFMNSNKGLMSHAHTHTHTEMFVYTCPHVFGYF